jgi:predicted ATP-binding protein involved in virulence
VTEAKRGIGSRFDGYIDALDPASNHRLLTEWMYQQTLVELQGGKPVLQLRAIERAVCQCIEGTTRFFFDVKSQELQLERADGEILPFSFLSDGYRNMVAVVADVAWRSAVLNPQHGADAAALAEGVVLVDEVDLHLHPRWQRRVLGDLRRTFPRVQFVATTHSPQVIASAHRDEVRVLDRNTLVPLRPFVEGRDTNSLLEDVFGVPDRPAKAQREIDVLSRLLDDEEYEQAAAVLEALEAKLGPDDPAVIRARWTLDREAVAEGS